MSHDRIKNVGELTKLGSWE